LFRNRFFGREEGGTNVRQVWIEVKVTQAVGLGRAGRCDEALVVVKGLGSPVAGLAFTENGLQRITESARTDYLLGELSATCGQKADADRRYQISSQAGEASQVVWAWAAARKRVGYDSAQWQTRLTLALSEAESRSQTSALKGWWAYSIGILQIALGRDEKGQSSLREALLLPDSLMSDHFARLALDGATPR
jgi:hypothetical protein